jgi:hypothetical protein
MLVQMEIMISKEKKLLGSGGYAFAKLTFGTYGVKTTTIK